MVAAPPSLRITTAAAGTNVTRTHRPLRVASAARCPGAAAPTTSTPLMGAPVLRRKSTKVGLSSNVGYIKGETLCETVPHQSDSVTAMRCLISNFICFAMRRNNFINSFILVLGIFFFGQLLLSCISKQ